MVGGGLNSNGLRLVEECKFFGGFNLINDDMQGNGLQTIETCKMFDEPRRGLI